jgi:NAD(P)H-nitrite reductase large subunit
LVHANAVCVGFGFTPSVELAANLGCPLEVDRRDGSVVVSVDRMLRTGVRNVLAAGEITGVGGAVRAAWQGTVAGLAAAVATGRLAEIDSLRAVAALRRHIMREERFAAALHAVYPVRPGWRGWLRPDTVLCRCEEVTAGRAEGCISTFGADDLRSLRLLTRVGMGPCQGRICGYPAAALLDGATGRQPDMIPILSRPIVTPVPLATLASEPSPPPPAPPPSG